MTFHNLTKQWEDELRIRSCYALSSGWEQRCLNYIINFQQCCYHLGFVSMKEY